MMVNDDQEQQEPIRVIVYLDDDTEPLLTYEPPVRFELDTSRLEDGHHKLRIEAFGATGEKGVRIIPFTVRNGPGIAVNGLSDNDVLEGKIPILVNSYGGAGVTRWEPSRAETPAPIPTWAWVLFIVIVAFGAFYGVRQWNPPPEFAATPTYGPAYGDVMTKDAGGFDVLSVKPMGDSGAEAGSATSEAPTTAALGATVYSSNCASCHQANGQGLPGVFPPLAGDPVVTAEDPAGHIKTVLHGLQGKAIDGVRYASPMPAFASLLSDDEIAAVINHERSSWGNNAPTVTAGEVAKLRKP